MATIPPILCHGKHWRNCVMKCVQEGIQLIIFTSAAQPATN